MKPKELREELQALRNEGEPFVLLTTGSYAGEGFDLAKLDTLMLVMPTSGKTAVQQYLGRLLRNLDEKDELRIYDYVDYAVPLVYRIYQKRLRNYKKLNYIVHDDQQTALSKSNLFTENCEEIIFSDLESAQEGLICLARLHLDYFNRLSNLPSPSRIKLILPSLTSINSKSQKTYKEQVEYLIGRGYQVIIREQINQNCIIINHSVVWLLPSQGKDAVSLRLISRDIAGRLMGYYGER
ncbi:hypothetical protein ESZ54_04980 [Vagococcus silagei]|uniref:Helicase C-terminal domain-containing protein n=2 Tax=Vagococcus silagei TaxID=2508885 RepID=A0A4S3B6K8_9ENTE|nr:hypothetical protein ESZ54_04980 [Vagococcus silagei]